MLTPHKTQLTLLLLVPLAFIASCRSPKASAVTASQHCSVHDSLNWTRDYLRRFTIRDYRDILLLDTLCFVWTATADSAVPLPTMITRSSRLTADVLQDSADTVSVLGSSESATERADSSAATAVSGRADETAQVTEGSAPQSRTRLLCLISLVAGLALGLLFGTRHGQTLRKLLHLLR